MSKKSTPEKSTPHPMYSQRFLAQYGRTLTREELRLVQGYRGLTRNQRKGLHAIITDVIINNVRTGTRAGAR